MLLRRLPLVIIAGVIAAVAGVGTWLMVPPTQQSTAAVLFVPSVKQPGVQGPTNPLLSLGNSVSIVASVVQIAVSDDHTVAVLADAGHTAKYEVVPDLSENAGPVLLITVEDPSFSQAEGTRDAVIAEVQRQLDVLQDERRVPSDLRVSSVVLTSSSEPKPIHKPQVQFALLATAGTLMVLLLLILDHERRAERRRRHTGREGERAPRRRPTASGESSDSDTPHSLAGSRRA